MTEEKLSLVRQKIYEHSGITLANVQVQKIQGFIEARLRETGASFDEYFAQLKPGTEAFLRLINESTVNETYFFREEKQFCFLMSQVFPKFVGKKIHIWSAACSTGEEPLSLLALALHCGLDAIVYASDINENALAAFRAGSYPKFSFRPDGASLHPLLENYGGFEGNRFVFSPDFISRINIFNYNLNSSQNPPIFDRLDLIFMRNVFIYFDADGRSAITRKISSLLAEGGLLFYSMNEIGSISDSIADGVLEKQNDKRIYYFEKKTQQARHILAAARERRQESPARAERKPADIKALAQKASSRREQRSAAGAEVTSREKPAGADERLTQAGGAAPRQDRALQDEGLVKKAFEAVCREIDRSNYVGALKLAGQQVPPEQKPYFIFMQGYTEYHADNKEKAEELFRTAEGLKEDFWPSFFYHGLLLKDTGDDRRAAECFAKCLFLLDSGDSKARYDFTLDDFSPAYIRTLCQKFQQEGAE